MLGGTLSLAPVKIPGRLIVPSGQSALCVPREEDNQGRRLREAAEELRRKSTSACSESANHQSESSVQRISRQFSARFRRPSSQLGDAESPPE